MSWQEQTFGPMLERTLENAQVRLLATEYDLSEDSRLARAIAEHVNSTLDAEEKERGVKRVRPGEMLLQTSRGDVVLPIRLKEDLERAVAGEPLERIRKDIVARCLDRYREHYPEAQPFQIERLMRSLLIGRGVRRKANPDHGINRNRRERSYGPVTGELAKELTHDAERAVAMKPSERPRPGHLPETMRKLTHFLGEDAGVAPAVREPMLLDLVRLRARFCPRISVIDSGQMPLVAMHVTAGRTLHRPTRHQPFAPILVSLLTPGELKELGRLEVRPYDEMMDLHARRMARVLVEAYQQDGLLSHAELQWCFLTSLHTVSRVLDWYQRKHRVVLPSPGSVLDMGRMLTHKDLIVRLHLQGLSVLEISRQTYHAPRSVDAYLRAFDAVLILHLYGLSPSLMARVLGRGISLVEEYLLLIEEYLKGIDEMRGYLRDHGVEVPARRLSNGA